MNSMRNSFPIRFQIWSDKNVHFHGKSTLQASQHLRKRISDQVSKVYSNPPKHHNRLAKIGAIPLKDRLRRSTTNLQRWLSLVNHQKPVSKYMSDRYTCNQLSLRESFKRANILISDYQKFPP